MFAFTTGGNNYWVRVPIGGNNPAVPSGLSTLGGNWSTADAWQSSAKLGKLVSTSWTVVGTKSIQVRYEGGTAAGGCVTNPFTNNQQRLSFLTFTCGASASIAVFESPACTCK